MRRRAAGSIRPSRFNRIRCSKRWGRTRVAQRWRALGKSRALIPYLTAGFPTAAVSRDALRRVAAAGADFVEIGVPFSDPLADGPTIQRTTQQALEQGMTLPRVLDLVRESGVAIPIIIMT